MDKELIVHSPIAYLLETNKLRVCVSIAGLSPRTNIMWVIRMFCNLISLTSFALHSQMCGLASVSCTLALPVLFLPHVLDLSLFYASIGLSELFVLFITWIKIFRQINMTRGMSLAHFPSISSCVVLNGEDKSSQESFPETYLFNLRNRRFVSHVRIFLSLK